MKIIRLIFAIPLGILISFVAMYTFSFLTGLTSLISEKIFNLIDWIPTFFMGMCWALFPVGITYIKRKIIWIISLIIGLISFLLYGMYFNLWVFSFLLGLALGGYLTTTSEENLLIDKE